MIQTCISGYLIKKSYLQLSANRLSEFKQREDGVGLKIILKWSEKRSLSKLKREKTLGLQFLKAKV